MLERFPPDEVQGAITDLHQAAFDVTRGYSASTARKISAAAAMMEAMLEREEVLVTALEKLGEDVADARFQGHFTHKAHGWLRGFAATLVAPFQAEASKVTIRPRPTSPEMTEKILSRLEPTPEPCETGRIKCSACGATYLPLYDDGEEYTCPHCRNGTGVASKEGESHE